MVIFFARHGESEANILKIFANEGGPYGLTELGRKQASELADLLAGEKVTRVFASPLLRAQQTATIIGDSIGLQFETRMALREFGVGDHEGSCEKEAWEEYRTVERAWLLEGNSKARIGGGECYDDIAARFLPFIDELKATYGATDEHILLVGHGGTFACMLPLVLANIDMSFAQAHPFRPASYVKSHLEGDSLICDRWIDVDLDALPQPIPN